LTACKVTQHSD